MFFFSSRRRHTRFDCDWSSDVCSSDLPGEVNPRINGRLDEFVMKALAIETTERFQDESEMSEALARLRAGGKRTFSKDFTDLKPIGDGKREKMNLRADQARSSVVKIVVLAN